MVGFRSKVSVEIFTYRKGAKQSLCYFLFSTKLMDAEIAYRKLDSTLYNL